MHTFLALSILLIILIFIIALYIIVDAAIELEKSICDEFDTPFTKADMEYLESLDKNTQYIKNK